MTDSAEQALTFRELLAYTVVETAHWHRWLAAQPSAVLDVPECAGARQAGYATDWHHDLLRSDALE